VLTIIHRKSGDRVNELLISSPLAQGGRQREALWVGSGAFRSVALGFGSRRDTEQFSDGVAQLSDRIHYKLSDPSEDGSQSLTFAMCSLLLALTACVAFVTAHYSPTLAAQRDHRGFRALPKIQSYAHRNASTHRRKGRRRWHGAYHHQAKHVKAVLKTPYGGQHPKEVKKQIDVVQQQVFATRATAPEKPIQLNQAPGRDKVEAHCGGCHSLDYVIMNSPFLNASGWDAEVAKMINAFGAPIDQSDAEIIADYLKKNYGM
jgi:hypothetical protein